MNGIHDMGGMEGLGEIGFRENETGFHEPWEVRLFALVRAMRSGSLRTEIERIPAPDYLRLGYYERWYSAFTTRIIDSGFVTRTELDSGRAEPATAKETPALTTANAREYISITPKEEREIELAPRFRVGEHVRGRNMNPTTHTRMPRYTRSKAGVVERDRGIFDLPDSVHSTAEPKPQHVYLVRFTGQELWGPEAPANDSVYIDMWEDYLESA